LPFAIYIFSSLLCSRNNADISTGPVTGAGFSITLPKDIGHTPKMKKDEEV
jgi:hypothetical protein